MVLGHKKSSPLRAQIVNLKSNTMKKHAAKVRVIFETTKFLSVKLAPQDPLQHFFPILFGELKLISYLCSVKGEAK